MHTDPISDMLTRIRNASMAKKDEVVLPYSKIKHEVAKVLSRNGYTGEVTTLRPGSLGSASSAQLRTGRDRSGSLKIGAGKGEEKNKFDELRIVLKYKDGQSVITKIKRISSPGRRVYTAKDNLPYVLNNLGIAIISTPQGLMTNKEARKKGVGGEVICEVY